MEQLPAVNFQNQFQTQSNQQLIIANKKLIKVHMSKKNGNATAKRSRIKQIDNNQQYNGDDMILKSDMTPKQGSKLANPIQQKSVPKTVKNNEQQIFNFKGTKAESLNSMVQKKLNTAKIISNQVPNTNINETRVTEQLNESSSNENANDDYKMNMNIKSKESGQDLKFKKFVNKKNNQSNETSQDYENDEF